MALFQRGRDTSGADLIASGHFSPDEPGLSGRYGTRSSPPVISTAIWVTSPTTHGRRRKVAALYLDPDAWTRKAILNVGACGKFSSDRSIAEYAAQIWNVRPCPVT